MSVVSSIQTKMVIFRCSQCGSDEKVIFEGCADKEDKAIQCSSCSYQRSIPTDTSFERCVFCSCKAFFVQKSIHPAFMLGGLLFAIILVPWTYGLSLPILWLLDVFIHKAVPNLLVCYRCRAGFAGFSIPKRFKVFQHHIGARYDESYDS